MNDTPPKLLALLAATMATTALAACAGSTSSDVIGTTDDHTGAIQLTNPDPSRAPSGFVFDHIGAAPASIANLRITLATGEVIPGVAGIGVDAGASITWLFDTRAVHAVSSLAFELSGASADLVVTGSQQTGPAPGTE